MTQYNISLKVSDKELSMLYDALAYYSSMGEETSEYAKEDVSNLLEKVNHLYLEEDLSCNLSPAEQAFVEQFGVDGLIKNDGRWQGFLAAWEALNSENNQE